MGQTATYRAADCRAPATGLRRLAVAVTQHGICDYIDRRRPSISGAPVHRHPALVPISAILVAACNQPLRPPVDVARPLFASAAAASRYRALDLGRFLPAAINSRGDVAGTVGIGGSQHAVVWRNGVLRDLGTLPPESPDDPDTRFFSFVTGMNSRGQIVGSESLFPPLEDVRAFVWDNGVLRDLNNPGGCCGGRNIAEAISEAGHVTG